MDKEYILDNLEFLSVHDIVMAILKGIVTLEEIEASAEVDYRKRMEIKLSLLRAYEERRHFEEEIRDIEKRRDKLEKQVLELAEEGCMSNEEIERLIEKASNNINESIAQLQKDIQKAEFIEEGDLIRFNPSSLRQNLESVFERANVSYCECIVAPGSDKIRRSLGGKIKEGLINSISWITSALSSGVAMAMPTDSLQDENEDALEENPEDETVYSAVYAPVSAELNRWFRVQAHLYCRSDAERSKLRAREMDVRAQLMEEKPLDLRVAREEVVEAEIKFYDDGVQVAQSKRTLVWKGKLTTAVFQVKACDARLGSVAGDIVFSKNGIFLGVFSFVTDIVSSPVEKETLVLGKARAYKTAFISYAHEDSLIANTVHTLLTDAGYEVFLDRENLAPGDLFNERIMESIEKSDVFYLLWSKDAAASDYVEKEYMHAYPLAYPPKPERPSLQFRPFFIEQPHTDPPEALKQVNFVDLYS